MVAMVADVVDQRAVPVEDQHVLVEAAGGEAVDGRKIADGFGREHRDRHQRKGEDDERRQEEGPTAPVTALAPAEQPKAAVDGRAELRAPGHQAGADGTRLVLVDITKHDSEVVMTRARTEYTELAWENLMR